MADDDLARRVEALEVDVALLKRALRKDDWQSRYLEAVGPHMRALIDEVHAKREQVDALEREMARLTQQLHTSAMALGESRVKRIAELERELAAEQRASRDDPAEQRAERYALEAVELSRKVIELERDLAIAQDGCRDALAQAAGFEVRADDWQKVANDRSVEIVRLMDRVQELEGDITSLHKASALDEERYLRDRDRIEELEREMARLKEARNCERCDELLSPDKVVPFCRNCTENVLT